MAQTLTTENIITWAARPEHVTSFTNDRTILNIVKYFLRNPKKPKNDNRFNINKSVTHKIHNDSTNFTNWDRRIDISSEKMDIADHVASSGQDLKNDVEIVNFETQFLQTFAVIIYECVIKDKVSLIPLWTNIVRNIEIIEKRPNSFSIWQIKLICSHLLKSFSVEEKHSLLSKETILAMKQTVSLVLDTWEAGKYIFSSLMHNFIGYELIIIEYFDRSQTVDQNFHYQWNYSM